MTLQAVLDATMVYNQDATWNLRADYIPYNASMSQQNSLRDMIEFLYVNSPNARTMLDQLASQGAIRVGLTTSDQIPGAYVRSVQDQTGSYSDPYIFFRLDASVTSIDADGRVFLNDPLLVLAHELSHWAYNYADPQGAAEGTFTDANLNDSGYDHLGTVTQFEHLVAADLNLPDRLDYFDGVTAGPSSQLAVVTSEADWTGFHHVDVVRIGDTVAGSRDNTIDYSSWANQPSILAFGLDGNDTITGADQNDYLYGNAGSDELNGLGGNDVLFGSTPQSLFDQYDGTNTLYGDDGQDKLFAGPNGDILYGGNDDDIIIGGKGDDQIHGGQGDDLIFTGGGRNTVFGGSGNDRIVLSKPGESGQLSSLSVIEGGTGNDTIWLSPDSVMHKEKTPSGSTYYIHDSDPGDSLVWHGYDLTGGVFTVMKEPTNYEVFNGGAAWLGDHGVVYALNDQTATLRISLPDNSTVEIDDFQNGDFGMTFNASVPGGYGNWDNLPRANISNEPDLGPSFGGVEFGTSGDHLSHLAGRLNAFDNMGSHMAPDLAAASVL